MGLRIVLETEQHRELAAVEDPTNILHRILPASNEGGSRLLHYVDWYGNTVFNYLQVDDVVADLESLKAESHDTAASELLTRLIALAQQVKEQRFYLVFVGD